MNADRFTRHRKRAWAAGRMEDVLAMRYESGPEDLRLADYADVLRHWWWIVAAVAIIGTAGAAGYLEAAPKVYTASASVYVTATSGTVNQVANGRTTGAVNLDTQAQVVQSTVVAQAAARLMHVTDPVATLVSRVSVTVPANSQVLLISCEARAAVRAASCAQAFAQAYLTYTAASATAAASSQLSVLQARISSLQSTSAKLTVGISGLPENSSPRAAAEEQLRSARSLLSLLNNQVGQLTAALADPSGGSIISSAIPPSRPASPQPLLVLPSGLLGGLLLGLVLAFLADRRDRRVRRRRDLGKLGVPVLMDLPPESFSPDLSIAVPRSPAGRDFAGLAHELTGLLGAGHHVVMVTGAAAGYGASLVAANLAAALSRSQPDVTLVCASLAASAVPSLAGLAAGPGLTDMLESGLAAEQAGQPVPGAPRLRLIMPGTAAGSAADGLPLDALQRQVAELSDTARWVILEAPPAMSGPDASTLAHVAGAAILVVEVPRRRVSHVRVPRARISHVRDSVRRLGKLGVPVLGVVLLPAPGAPPRRIFARSDLGHTAPPAPAASAPAASAPAASSAATQGS
ncbi:MAG TPA: Wzz/FepE/Etk N-terminal domain-containing protein [Streptosporangiaceae bacterium]|nr:Wzz/FepE/Etk N-terminal domain-containing protein [Streptosporangiaceae bacterium]